MGQFKQATNENKRQYRFPIFRERLDKLRGTRTNTEFADFLGMSRQTIGFYLNGERIPDILGLVQIAEKCNVSTDWLVGLSESASRDADINQICNYTGLSEESVGNLKQLKDMSRVGILTSVGKFITLAKSNSETPIGIVDLTLKDIDFLYYIFYFFALEDMDDQDMFKNVRSNAVLLEIMSSLIQKRNKLRRE